MRFFQVWSGENKLDNMPRDFEKAKAEQRKEKKA